MQTIDDVLQELGRITDQAIADNEHLGVFAYVYWRTTAEIKRGIIQGRFEDGPRMERMDVIFAKRYIDAYHQYRAGQPVSKVWRLAFDARREPITLLQHLLLGMNAHINLDLGIAAADAVPGSAIHELEKDFMTVNAILAEIGDEMQERLSRASRLLFLLDWVGGRKDEQIVNFSIGKARGFAWEVAVGLAKLDGRGREDTIRGVDETATQVGKAVLRPPGRLLPWVLRLIQRWEEKEVGRVVELLKGERRNNPKS